MSPSELDAYLGVLRDRHVAACVLTTADFTLQVNLEPDLPPLLTPAPGGWKPAPDSLHHLDNPGDLEPARLHEGSLP